LLSLSIALDEGWWKSGELEWKSPQSVEDSRGPRMRPALIFGAKDILSHMSPKRKPPTENPAAAQEFNSDFSPSQSELILTQLAD
jgi:hypothetical protein